jgi:nucleoside 2-deoxyribosyltransferase
MIYIAAPLAHKDFNLQLAEAIEAATDFAVAVPNRFQRPISNMDEARDVADYCYNLISFAKIVVVVRPIGLSTAAELGFLIAHKRAGRNIHVISLNTKLGLNPHEDMLDPYFDSQANSIDEVIQRIQSLEMHLSKQELTGLKDNKSLLSD